MIYIIQNDKIKLRRANSEDASLLCKWYTDGRIMKHVGFPNGIKEDVEELSKKLSDKTYKYIHFIIMNENNRPIGVCHYSLISKEKCEIGIKICIISYQEKGYGKASLKALFNYLFKEIGIKEIVLDTLVENHKAQRLYKSVGFKEVGIKKNFWIDQVGKSRSAIDMKLTKENYYKYNNLRNTL